jgi:hypothetical protein
MRPPALLGFNRQLFAQQRLARLLCTVPSGGSNFEHAQVMRVKLEISDSGPPPLLRRLG